MGPLTVNPTQEVTREAGLLLLRLVFPLFDFLRFSQYGFSQSHQMRVQYVTNGHVGSDLFSFFATFS